MGDYLSYGTLTTPAATDRLLVCTPASAEVMQDTRAHFLPTVELGTTTLTGVGTLVLESGTLTGSSGGTAGLGTATYTPPSGGGGGLPLGPFFGIVGTFTVPALSACTVLAAPTGTSFNQPISGGPLIYEATGSTSGDGLALLQTDSVSGLSTWTCDMFFENQAYERLSPGILVTDGTNYAIYFPYVAGEIIYCQKYSSPTSYNGNVFENTWYGPLNVPFWLRLVYDGTYLNFYWSANGIVFSPTAAVGAFTPAACGLGTMTGIGFGLYVGGETAPAAAYLWHRKLAS